MSYTGSTKRLLPCFATDNHRREPARNHIPIGVQSPTIDRLAEIATLDKVGLAIAISTEAKDTGKRDSQRDFLNEDCFAVAKNEEQRSHLQMCCTETDKN